MKTYLIDILIKHGKLTVCRYGIYIKELSPKFAKQKALPIVESWLPYEFNEFHSFTLGQITEVSNKENTNLPFNQNKY